MGQPTSEQQPVEDLDFLLRNITYFMNQIARKFAAEQGLSVPRFWVLINVNKHPGLTMGELQNKMYLAPSSVSALVDNLVESKLLRRARDQEDRRVIRLLMTAEGEKILQKILQFRYQRLEEALDGVEVSDFVALTVALEHLFQSLQRQLERIEKVPGFKEES